MRVYMGCGGFSNEDWKAPGLIYHGARKDDYLGIYADHFDTLELNSSFYGIPGHKSFEGMLRKSKGRVRFTVKLHRVFTHDRHPDDNDYDRMLQSPEPLREAGVLGPYLAQFPYSFQRQVGNRKYLLKLAKRFAGHEVAVEFRHASWDIPEVREGMKEFGLIWASPDYPPVDNLPAPQLHVTGDIGYLRLHGRNTANWWEGESAAERHDYRYSQAELEDWADKIAAQADQLSELYLMWENTTKGHALHNAPILRAALNERGVAVETPEPEVQGLF